MKKKYLAIILVALSGLCGSNSLLALDVQSCSQFDTTHIYYGNGVDNTLMEAQFSRNTLVYAYFIKYNIRNDFPNQKFKFLVAYNFSRGAVLDIIETINQKVDETGGLTAEEILYLMKLSKKAALRTI